MGVNRYLGGVVSADPNTPTVTSASGTWTLEEAYQNIGNWPMAQSQIQNSLRFNSADSAYLSRTPSVASNRKTWTISFWVKFTAVINNYFLGAGDTDTGGGSGFAVRLNSNSTMKFSAGGGVTMNIDTVQVFRDPSAWYHIVIAMDTTQSTASNRVKVYVNGVEAPLSITTSPAQNINLDWNSSSATSYIGAYYGSGLNYSNCYLTELNSIDGLALDPDYFGFTDANGIWQPKQYKGEYGTNGFYLPFNKEYDLSASYLVVAGGGSGGGGSLSGGGGGGAGGYRTGSVDLFKNTTYTVTVGAGGTGTSGVGNNGNDSVFASITSTGGGKGAGAGSTAGSAGGSGGGGSALGAGAGGAGNTPSTSPSQGSNGGSGNNSGGSNWGAGGGGGASAVGSNGSTGGGNGGAGSTTDITGTSTTYAGGGGGAGDAGGNGSGGAGGGGAGNAAGTGTAGTANTGGGGGGGNIGGNGGSGIVVIKIPNTNTASFSGGVTYTTITSVSGYNIYRVTATSTTSETVTFS